jgi:hypothetical protein
MENGRKSEETPSYEIVGVECRMRAARMQVGDEGVVGGEARLAVNLACGGGGHQRRQPECSAVQCSAVVAIGVAAEGGTTCQRGPVEIRVGPDITYLQDDET